MGCSIGNAAAAVRREGSCTLAEGGFAIRPIAVPPEPAMNDPPQPEESIQKQFKILNRAPTRKFSFGRTPSISKAGKAKAVVVQSVRDHNNGMNSSLISNQKEVGGSFKVSTTAGSQIVKPQASGANLDFSTAFKRKVLVERPEPLNPEFINNVRGLFKITKKFSRSKSRNPEDSQQASNQGSFLQESTPIISEASQWPPVHFPAEQSKSKLRITKSKSGLHEAKPPASPLKPKAGPKLRSQLSQEVRLASRSAGKRRPKPLDTTPPQASVLMQVGSARLQPTASGCHIVKKKVAKARRLQTEPAEKQSSASLIEEFSVASPGRKPGRLDCSLVVEEELY